MHADRCLNGYRRLGFSRGSYRCIKREGGDNHPLLIRCGKFRMTSTAASAVMRHFGLRPQTIMTGYAMWIARSRPSREKKLPVPRQRHKRRHRNDSQKEKRGEVLCATRLSFRLTENKQTKKPHPSSSQSAKSGLQMRLQGLEPWTNRLRVYCSTN